MFAKLSLGSGVLILVVLAGVAAFLVAEAWPALTAPAKEVPEGHGLVAYVWPLLFGTLISAVFAMVIAVPLAISIALFLTQYAPPRIAQVLGYILDLLAAIPSVIYGVWGLAVLAPATIPLHNWLAAHLGWIPLFAGPPSATGSTMLLAILVLAVMILPIITAIVRDAFMQAPRLHQEASLALGATHWEMIRMSVLPHGRSAIVGASMIGLGRALGETMALAMVMSISGGVTFNLISRANPSTIAARIALDFPEADTATFRGALIAAGLVLFLVTLLVNMAARAIIARTSEAAGADR